MRRKHKRRQTNKEDMELQITSLADILVVVLVFLLKSVSLSVDSVEEIKVPQNIHLPLAAIEEVSGDKGVKIEISENAVQINGTPGAQLQGFRFASSDLNHDFEQASSSKALGTSLAQYRSTASLDPSKKGEMDRIWVLADQRVPYTTIQTVLASAALQGYKEFKLAVSKGD